MPLPLPLYRRTQARNQLDLGMCVRSRRDVEPRGRYSLSPTSVRRNGVGRRNADIR